MSQPILTGAILETTMIGDLFNQKVMNILHYRFTGPSTPVDGAITIDQFHGLFRQVGGPWDKWKACMTIEATNLHLRHQWIYPTRYRSITPGYTLEQGSGTGSCKSANHAVALSKFGQLAGRGRTGTMHMFGVATQDQLAGNLNTGAGLKYDVLGAQLITVIVPEAGQQMTPVIFDRKAPGSSQQMTGTQTQVTLRVQRRRTVGVGI